MSKWNPRKEWQTLVVETKVRHLQERTVQKWGELGELLTVAVQAKELEKTSKSGENLGKAAKNLLSLTPVGWIQSALALGGQLKDLGDVMQNAADMDDEQAEKSPLMTSFNIDDGYSEILDDRLETEFVKWLSGWVADKIRSDGDSDIPDSLDINKMLEQFLEERGDYDESVTNAGSMSKFTDIEYPEQEAKWKKSFKAMGKGFFSGLF